MSQLSVAVEAVKQEEGVVAVAVVYAVTTAAPSFRYVDRRGRPRVVSFDDFTRIPAELHRGVLRHLKRSALSYAYVVRRDDDDRQAAMCFAVARALERLAHTRGTLSRGRVVLHVVGKAPLPSERVGHIPQQVWGRRRDAPWMLSAATVLAKSPRAVLMMPA